MPRRFFYDDEYEDTASFKELIRKISSQGKQTAKMDTSCGVTYEQKSTGSVINTMKPSLA